VCQCAKHKWAHGDGNLRVFRVVPERRPNRRKVLAPTSAPEGGTILWPEALQGGHAHAGYPAAGLAQQETCQHARL
jgi:hypothetical protein